MTKKENKERAITVLPWLSAQRHFQSLPEGEEARQHNSYAEFRRLRSKFSKSRTLEDYWGGGSYVK